MQTSLFTERSFGSALTAPKTNGKKTSFADPAFASNKALPVHRWVGWIAGFSSDFVRGVIEHELGDRKGVVLDPFAGVGTTLVEAAFLGHDVVGFEINPYPHLACHVKLEAGHLDPEAIRLEITRMEAFMEKAEREGRAPESGPPAGFSTRKTFYSEAVLKKVLTLQDFITGIEDEIIRRLFQTAFASTMVSYSNYSYEPSLGTREAAGRADIEDADVAAVVGAKLREMADDVEWVHANTKAADSHATIHHRSFFGCETDLPGRVADVAITSPPYVNNYHYIRNTRPHLYWLGFAEKPKDTKYLEQENFGKYWQTVRDAERVELDFEGAPPDLIRQIEELRALNTEKGVYGGNGWANYVASYFNDCYRFAKSLHHTLKPGASCYVVIGNSIIQGLMVPTDIYLGEIARLAGLDFDGLHVPRAERVGSSIIQSDVRVSAAGAKDKLYEAVVVLKKP